MSDSEPRLCRDGPGSGVGDTVSHAVHDAVSVTLTITVRSGVPGAVHS